MVAPQRNPARGEMYSAARGAGLIGLAVLVGIILFRIVDDPGTPSSNGGDGGGGTAETVITQETLPDNTTQARDPAAFTTIVLNASGQGGAAQNLSNQLRANGYNTLTPSNATLQEGTTVQCQEGFEAEANVLALAVGGGTVEPYETPPADAGADAAAANCVVYLGQTGATSET